MTESKNPGFWSRRRSLALLVVLVAALAVSLSALLVNILQKKVESQHQFVRVVEVDENDTSAEKWGRNWPLQYDGYRRTAFPTHTRFGGHAGSEALPEEKIARDPWLKRMFLGSINAGHFRDVDHDYPRLPSR